VDSAANVVKTRDDIFSRDKSALFVIAVLYVTSERLRNQSNEEKQNNFSHFNHNSRRVYRWISHGFQPGGHHDLLQDRR
jgi:hypothetical protein